jgi:hypothetical protein
MIRVEAKSSARKRIKGLIAALAVVGGVALIPASSATAHVHGITPLNCLPQVPDNAGANQTDNTPANAVIGPGLIPNDPGHAAGRFGNGGSDTPPCE